MSYRLQQPRRAYVVVQDGDLRWNEPRSKRYVSAKEAARWAKELARRNKLYAVYTVEMAPPVEDTDLSTLLADAGLTSLDEATRW